MELTNEHIEILKHAEKGLVCGDSPEMRDLCKLKMMRFARWGPLVQIGRASCRERV